MLRCGQDSTVTAVKLCPAARQANTDSLIKRMRTAHFSAKEYNGGHFFKRVMELQRKNGALDTYALCEPASSGELYQKVDAGVAAGLYDSRYAQEELRECLADVIRLRLLRKIRLAGAFSVLGDEATDVTTRAQLIIMVRFVNLEPDTAGYGKPMTAVLETVPLPRGNAAVIADAYVAALNRWGIPVDQLFFSTSDGASVFSGIKAGVHVRLRDQCNFRLVDGVWCGCHRFPLALIRAMSTVPYAKDAIEIIEHMGRFFRFSNVRQAVLREEYDKLGETAKKLVESAFTRWLSHDASTASTAHGFTPLLGTLLHLLTGETVDWKLDLDDLPAYSKLSGPDQSARFLYTHLCCAEFIFVLCLFRQIFPRFARLSRQLQAENCDFVTHKQAVAALLVELTKLGTKEKEDELLDHVERMTADAVKHGHARAAAPRKPARDLKWQLRQRDMLLKSLRTEIESSMELGVPQLAAIQGILDVTHYPDDLRNRGLEKKPRWSATDVHEHFAEHIKVLNERYAHDWVDPDTGEAPERSKDVFPWSITELEEVLVAFGAPIRNELEKAQWSWAAKDAARKLEQQRKRKAEEAKMAESSAQSRTRTWKSFDDDEATASAPKTHASAAGARAAPKQQEPAHPDTEQVAKAPLVFLCTALLRSAAITAAPLIQKLVEIALCAAVGTATVERAVSTLALTHSKLRNRLDSGVVNQELMILINGKRQADSDEADWDGRHFSNDEWEQNYRDAAMLFASRKGRVIQFNLPFVKDVQKGVEVASIFHDPGAFGGWGELNYTWGLQVEETAEAKEHEATLAAAVVANQKKHFDEADEESPRLEVTETMGEASRIYLPTYHPEMTLKAGDQIAHWFEELRTFEVGDNVEVQFSKTEWHGAVITSVNEERRSRYPLCPTRWLFNVKYDDGDDRTENTDNIAYKDIMHRGDDIEAKKNPGYAEGTLQSVKGKNGRRWYVHYPSEDAQKSAGYWHDLTKSTYGVDRTKNQWWVLLKTRRPDPIDY